MKPRLCESSLGFFIFNLIQIYLIQNQETNVVKNILFVLIFLLSSAVFAGDFEDGLSAYARGDYQKAIEKFELAAKQGNADAEFSLGWMG
jgi:hypothetical protein